MRAAYVTELGAAAQIRYGDLPDPHPGPGQVLVEVEAVTVNSVDTFVRSGRWPTGVTFPLVVGRDLVGTVTGSGTGRYRPGDRVWTNSAGYDGRPGATSTLVAVDEDRLYPVPAGADPRQFVATLHPGATAYGVLERARTTAGETVVVTGASGSVGLCLVQVAAARGGEVVAVVRDGRTADRLTELGASRVVVGEPGPAVAELAGYDVLVDPTGHLDLGAACSGLRPRGRVVMVARGPAITLDPWPFYTRELQLLGFVMSAMTGPELAAAGEFLNHADPPLRTGDVEVAGFADAAEIHARIESAGSPRRPDGLRGRFVLVP